MLSRRGLFLAHLDIKAIIRNLSLPFSFTLPISLLYLFDPTTFQEAWKGRAPYLIFLWLFALEFALARRKISQKKFDAPKLIVSVMITAPMAIPTLYVMAEYLLGLNRYIVELGKLVNVPFGGRYGEWFLQYSWPLSLEYLLFTFFFTASVLLMYRVNGLKRFSVSLFFLGAISFFYTIDTFYPYGALVALQNFVPLTASSVTFILNWMGYKARWYHFTWYWHSDNRLVEDVATILTVSGGRYFLPPLAIYWPSSGIHSLIMYTLVILLFIKNAPFSLHRDTIFAGIPERLRVLAKSNKISFLLGRKILSTAYKAAGALVVDIIRMTPIYLIVTIGALGTFLANVLRIVTICVIGLNMGPEAAGLFHDYYGELYFIVWIVFYLLVVIYWRNIATKTLKLISRICFRFHKDSFLQNYLSLIKQAAEA